MRCWQLVDSLCRECVFLQLGGVALIATGAFAAVSTDSFLWMVIDNRLISQAVYLVIAAGTLFFVIGILGLFGALMMDKTVLLVVSKKKKKTENISLHGILGQQKGHFHKVSWLFIGLSEL